MSIPTEMIWLILLIVVIYLLIAVDRLLYFKRQKSRINYEGLKYLSRWDVLKSLFWPIALLYFWTKIVINFFVSIVLTLFLMLRILFTGKE